MTMVLPDDPILARVRLALDQIYGQRIERAVLFGSRARGDASPDSDYDIAVFLRGPSGLGVERDRLADLGSEILFDALKVVHAIPWPAGAWRDRTPIMHEIRKDGIDL